VRYCPASTGNFNLENLVITDTFDANATFVSASDGGVRSGNTVTWTHPTADYTAGCIGHKVVLRYDSANGFTTSSTVTNRFDTTFEYNNGTAGTCNAPCGRTTHGFTLPTQSVESSKEILQNPIGIEGIGRFNIQVDTSQANEGSEDIILVDEFQDFTNFKPLSFYTGKWTNPAVTADYYTSSDSTCRTDYTNTALYTLVLQDHDGSTNELFTVAADNRCIKVDLGDAPLGFEFSDEFQVVFEPTDAAVAGTNYPDVNCLYQSFNGSDLGDEACADVRIADNINAASLTTDKRILGVQSEDGEDLVDPIPTSLVTFEVSTTLTERSTGRLQSLTIVDELSKDFEYREGSWVASISPAVSGTETFSITPTFTLTDGGAGNPDKLIWEWEDATQLDLDPEVAEYTIAIEFQASLLPFTAEGFYTNTAYYFVDNDETLVCESEDEPDNPPADTTDLNGNGNTSEVRCSSQTSYFVPATAVLRGQKWINNETYPQTALPSPGSGVTAGDCQLANIFTSLDDLGADPLVELDADGDGTDDYFNRYPCLTEGLPNDTFHYRLTVQNYGNVDLQDYILYDILPYSGDKGVSNLSRNNQRYSEWRPEITGIEFVEARQYTGVAVTRIDASDFIYYTSTSSNPCRAEVYEGNAPGCVNDWTQVTDPTTHNWATARSFKIEMSEGFFTGDEMEFLVTMTIPDDETIVDDAPFAGEITWNNYAHTADYLSDGNFDGDTTDPEDVVKLGGIDVIRVGIRIPETVSVGNLVFLDEDNDRKLDASEDGIANVAVSLYEWSGTDVVGAPVDTTTTDANGYYLFNLVPTGYGRGGSYVEYDPNKDYVIVIDDSNFASTGVLYQHLSSFDRASKAETLTADNQDRGTVDVTAELVRSAPFSLSPDELRTGEAELGGDGDPYNIPDDSAGADFGQFGHGNLSQDDNNSDVSVDFGFFVPLAVGNRVWFDLDTRNNSIEDANEFDVADGVDGVLVNLYLDSDANNILDRTTDTKVTSTTTSGGGFYIFDFLTEGKYFVELDPSNFEQGEVLADYIDSDLFYTDLDGDGNTPDFYEPDTNLNLDRDDDGRPFNFLADNGIRVTVFELKPTDEPTAEVDQRVNGQDLTTVSATPSDPTVVGIRFGNYGNRRQDESTNLTVDFGFYQPLLAIGNFVWDDRNNNSVWDNDRDGVTEAGEESGIDGVIVRLILDADADGVADATEIDGTGVGASIVETVTAGGGYYKFDNLSPNEYFLYLVPENWTNGATTSEGTVSTGALVEYIGSSRVDSIDTRLDPTNERGFPTNWDDQKDDGLNHDSYTNYDGDGKDYVNDGILSEQVMLIPVSEAPGHDDIERTLGNAHLGGDGDGNAATTGGTLVTEPHADNLIGADFIDSNSDLTVDFGVFKPMSIGNRVWLDTYESEDGTTRAGDGIFDDANENGINGVAVQLYKLHEGGDPTDLNDYTLHSLETTYGNFTDQADVTNDDGHYLFDGLGEGTYRVRVAEAEFRGTQTLVGYVSSNGVNGVSSVNTGDADENKDSGLDDGGTYLRQPGRADGINDGIWSDTIILTRDSEPTTETDMNEYVNGVTNRDDGPEGRGVYSETNDNSDLTVDFGFYKPMSLGNRLFYDLDGDGLDDDEPAVVNVTVELYKDSGDGADGTDGNADDFTLWGSVQTDSDGYYRFDALQLGDYYVRIPNDEFTVGSGNPLDGYISTRTLTANDLNDNGQDVPNPSTSGVRSETVTLAFDSEPTNDDDIPTTYGAGSFTPVLTTGEPIAEDDNTDLSIDFGFVRPFSLGNRVWLDLRRGRKDGHQQRSRGRPRQ